MTELVNYISGEATCSDCDSDMLGFGFYFRTVHQMGTVYYDVELFVGCRECSETLWVGDPNLLLQYLGLEIL